MSLATPRVGTRLSHTPKMSERKRALFQSENQLNSCKRNLAEDMKDDSNDSCDLGIISALDSSSSPERYDQSVPQTPNTWRSQTRRSQRLIKPNPKYVKDIIKSPLTFRNYSSRTKPLEINSAPTTPHITGNFGSPLSTEKRTLSTISLSGKPKARKSLTNLIADTESCSSSLKDLTFDSDSGADSKENTPSKKQTKFSRKLRAKRDSVSNYGSGPESDASKGNKANSSPLKSINSDYFSSPKSAKSCHLLLSKTQSPSMLKTPHDSQVLADETMSPPKMHNRKFVLEIIEESPMSAKDNEKCLKRIRDSHNSSRDYSPKTKQMKLESEVPKARLSLFNDKIKQFLTTKSFYPKCSVDLNSSFTTSVSHAIRAKYKSHGRRNVMNSIRSNKKSKRAYGEINMGVRHKIRKPKIVNKFKPYVPVVKAIKSGLTATKDASQNINTLEADKCDPFETEHQTIETLLNQWTEEDVPVNEPQVQFSNERLRHEIRTAESLVHHTTMSQAILHLEPMPNPTVLQAVTTPSKNSESSMDGYDIHRIGEETSGEFLPVDGGFILVDNTVSDNISEKPKNLEEIESEIRFLDDQIAKMAKINNINAELLLSPTSQMCDMASGLMLTSPKIINGVAVTETPVVNYDFCSAGEDIRLVYTSGDTNDGIPTESVVINPVHQGNSIPSKKLFPVFTKTALRGNTASVKAIRPGTTKGPKKMATHRDQYIIDAGQKKIGATQCSDCGVIYSIGDPQDEMDHLMHHNAVDVLRFPGWKDEFVCGVWSTARCVRVRGSESGLNGARWKRVLKLLDRVVHPQLGYANQLPSSAAQEYTAYLYIDNKQIIGCLIAEIKMKGNKFLPGSVYCCSREEYPVKCGISRLWTHISHRRHGVATHLVNSMRANFLYGQILTIEDLAFSAPTPAGRAFAESYTGTENFYVYVN